MLHAFSMLIDLFIASLQMGPNALLTYPIETIVLSTQLCAPTSQFYIFYLCYNLLQPQKIKIKLFKISEKKPTQISGTGYWQI